MFTIKTYISRDQKWYGDRLPAEEFQKQYFHFEKNKEVSKLRHLFMNGRPYGFVQIYYGEKEILGEIEYGSVTDIWGVLQSLVLDFLAYGTSVINFPDSVRELALTNCNEEEVLFENSVTNRKFTLPKKEFLSLILLGVITFYECVFPLYENDEYDYDYSKVVLDNLNAKLKQVDTM